MKKFEQKKSILSHLIPAFIILGATYFVINTYLLESSQFVRYSSGLLGLISFICYDKFWVINTTRKFVITDVKISELTRNGVYMYGLKWEDVKSKRVERFGGRVTGITFFPRNKLDFGEFPSFLSRFTKQINNIWVPISASDSEELLSLIEEYTAGIPEEESNIPARPKLTFRRAVLGALKIVAIFAVLFGIMYVQDLLDKPNKDKRYLSIEERKKIYSGQYEEKRLGNFQSLQGVLSSDEMLEDVLNKNVE